ncbi:MAG TPA: hypothetical protein VLA45_09890 [Paracoccaceae bacterium]|nr:hypothetical protein [Paracoccaceae bacterium]
MMRRFMGVSAAALLVAACGSGDEDAVQTEDAEVSSQVEQAPARSAIESVAGMPDGFSAYPGATVVTSTTIDTTDGSGVLAVMTTPDAADKVIAFYRAQAEAAGISIEGEMNANGTRLIGGEGAGGLAFSASASPGGEGATTVQLTVGRGM